MTKAKRPPQTLYRISRTIPQTVPCKLTSHGDETPGELAACAISGAVRPVFERLATDPLGTRNFVRNMDAKYAEQCESLLNAMRWATERVVAGKRSYTIEAVEVRQ